MPNSELTRLNLSHSVISGAQQQLYRAFAQTGKALGWDDLLRIESEALVRAGMTPQMAKGTVTKAIDGLKKAGVNGSTRIPWNK